MITGRIRALLIVGVFAFWMNGNIGQASQGETKPTLDRRLYDLVIQTRVEPRSLSWVFEKTRLIMGNAQMADLLTGEAKLDVNPTFELEDMTRDADVIKLRDSLSKVFKRDFKKAVIRLRIPKVYYQIERLSLNPHNAQADDQKLTLDTAVGLHGVTTRLTEGIYADVMLPNAEGQLESFLTAKAAPVNLHVPQSLGGLPFEVQFETLNENQLKFKLKGYNTDLVPGFIRKNLSSLNIQNAITQKPVSSQDFQINPVVVRLNRLERTVHFEQLKPVLQKQMGWVTENILLALGDGLKHKLGERLLKTVFSNGTRSDLVVANSYIHTRYAVTRFDQPIKDQLAIGIQGDLCTAELYRLHQLECVKHVEPFEPPRTISDQDFQKGLETITSSLAQNRADLVVSLSEDYINRLLKTTIDAKLWDEKLEEDNLGLGPKGVFTVFNRVTQKPELFIDLYYYGERGVEKIFINDRKPIRFPLRMSTSLSFPIRDGVPHMVIKTEKLISDAHEIINGIPEFELDSKLVRVFRRKIAKMVIEMAQKLEGQVAVDLDFPVMKDVGLEKTDYEVTPYGRLNWFFRP